MQADKERERERTVVYDVERALTSMGSKTHTNRFSHIQCVRM